MNQLAETTDRLPMNAVGMSTGSTGAKIAPQNLSEVVKFAEVMCRADIALPQHLRGNAGACMAVALQALEWQMSPFAVASKSYAVGGRIAYEAQLIAAVVNTRSGIKGRLKYRYDGEGASMTCTVTGTLDGEECEYTSPPVGSITVKNSPLWKSDPQQQLGYFAARSWARRHCPEVILGVYDRDEMEPNQGPDNARDITPQPTVMQRLRQNATQEATGEREGFSESFVHSETSAALDGEILTDTDTGSSSQPVEADEQSPAQSAEADETPNSSASSLSPETAVLIEFAKSVLPMAAATETTGAVLSAIEKEWAPEIKKLPAPAQEKAKAISRSMRAIFNNETSLYIALEFYAEVFGCTVQDLGGGNG